MKRKKFIVGSLLLSVSLGITTVNADGVVSTNTTMTTPNITMDSQENKQDATAPEIKKEETTTTKNVDEQVKPTTQVIEQPDDTIDSLIENSPKVIDQKPSTPLETVNNYKIGVFKIQYGSGKTFNFQANKVFTYNYKLPVPKLIYDDWSFNVFVKKIEDYFSDKNGKMVLFPQKIEKGDKYILVKQRAGQVKIDKEKFKADMMRRIKTADYSTVTLPLTDSSKELIEASKNEIIQLSQFTTYYDSGNIGRTQNIRMAGKIIGGTKLMPGETFSYNSRTKPIYPYLKVAKIIVGDEYVDGVGGGLCQPSTTLFNTALEAGLTINVRNNHSKVAHYVVSGRDAMVSSWSDMVFTNNLKHPVYIMYYQTGGNGITFAMYGNKSDKVYPKIWVSAGKNGYTLYRQIGKAVSRFSSYYK